MSIVYPSFVPQPVATTTVPAHTGKSIDKVEILVGLGEGPIEGLKDGLKSFYFGDTPVQQTDGTYSFDGLNIEIFPGDASPAPIHLVLGGSATSTTVGVQLYENEEVIRTTGSGNINFLDVRILANNIGKNDGGAWGVGLNILYKKTSQGSGAWQPFAGSETAVPGHKDINGRFTNQPFEWRQAVTPLTDGDTYDIKVVKTTPESDSKYARDISWESFQEITSGDKSYPNVAMAHVQAQATNQFSTVPQLWGVYRGFKCRVPVNYDPIARTFSGTWDGTFKIAWTNDPAWILYEIVMNSNWGFNAYYPCTIDKYDCYAASQWTSEKVSDGASGLQPRYTYNRWIKDPMDAMDLLNSVAGSFGARCFDDQNGTILLKMDIDSNAVILFAPENVENGLFNYSYSDLDQRYNDITVTFPNPALNWSKDRRYLKDDDSIAAVGRIHLDYELEDCTDVHEAIRRGYLRMISTITETEQVAFTTNKLGCTLSPFEIFLVSDPDNGYGLSGRVKSVTDNGVQTTIHLRDPLPLESNVLYTFNFQTPLGLMSYDFGTLATGSVMSITWPMLLDEAIVAGTTFTLGAEFNFATPGVPSGPTTSTIGLPKPYRCLKLSSVEGNPDKVQIVGLEVNRNKWYGSDNAIFTDDIEYSNRKPSTTVLPPQAPLTFNYVTRTLNGQTITTLNINWNKSSDMFISRYRIEYDYEGTGSQLLTETVNTNARFDNPKPGTYTFHVYALNTVGNPSPPLAGSTTVGSGTAALPPSPITGLEISGQGNNTIFTTQDVKFDWRTTSMGQNLDFDDEDQLQGAESGVADATFANFIIKFFDGLTGDFVYEDVTRNTFYTFSYSHNYATKNGPHRNLIVKVYYRDIYGNISTPATLAVSNPAPQKITGLTSADGDALVTFIWPKVLEPDINGYVLFTAKDDGVHGFVEELTYNGPNNTYVFTGPPNAVIRARVGAYDTFDSTYVLSDIYEVTIPEIDGAHLDAVTRDEIKSAFDLAVQGRNVLFGRGVDYAQAFEDLSAKVIQVLTDANGTQQLIREAGIEVDPVTKAVTIYSVKNLTGTVNGMASVVANYNTAVAGNATVFRQDTAPTALAVGDLWVDTSTSDNLVYRWTGAAWVFFGNIAGSVYTQANAITALQSTVNDPSTGVVATASALGSLTTTVVSQGSTITANSSAITALQSTVNNPSTGVVATASALSALSGTVTTQGTTITAQGVSITSINSAITDPVSGLAASASAISTLQTTVTNRSKTFVQGTTPTAFQVGDLWINTSAGNTILTWSGSAWVGRSDLNKVTTFAQTSTPTANAVGDVWINTTSGANTMSRWSGSSWVAVDNPVIASTATALTSLTSTVGNFSASGIFRVYVASTASGADATVAISVSATGGGSTQTAGIYLDAITGGSTSRVRIIASQFYISDGTTHQSPFYVSGGNVYIQNAFITNLDASIITTGTLYAGAIIAGSITTSKLASSAVTTAIIAANAVSNVAFSGVGTSTGIAASPSWTTVATASITTTGGPVLIQYSDWWNWPSGGAPAVYYRVMCSGGYGQQSYLQSGGGTIPDNLAIAGACSHQPLAGTYTYTLEATRVGGTTVNSRAGAIVLTELKR